MEVSIKVCGLTRAEDARLAMSLGADFGGVIGYPGSPRYVKFGEETALLAEIPEGRRVWVSVEPGIAEIENAFSCGFDFAQIHFDPTSNFDPRAVADRFDGKQLWFAPRLVDPRHFDERWIDFGNVFLIDGFSQDRMGGTGHRVDGEAFADLAARFPDSEFVLAGGINPENAVNAIRSSGAGRIDVNSGVESSPGAKDPGRMRRLFEAVR